MINTLYSRFCHKMESFHTNIIKNLLCNRHNLQVRKIVNATDISSQELKILLHQAIRLKHEDKESCELKGKTITLLLNKPCIRLQTCFNATAHVLDMNLNVLMNSGWEEADYLEDTAKLLSTSSDIIFCQSQKHTRAEKFAAGATVPVVTTSSCRSILLHVLSDLMTLQEHFGYLEGLKYAWIGTACPALNTCLAVAPLLGIDVIYWCHCGGGPLSPSNLKELQDTKMPQYTVNIHEAADLEKALSDVNVVSINNPPKKDPSHQTIQKNQIDKLAHKNWVFLHPLPRKLNEVDEEIFKGKNNLLWKSFANSKWVCAAIINYLLKEIHLTEDLDDV